jgi:hypothetical protein
MKITTGAKTASAILNYIASVEEEDFFPMAYEKDMTKREKQNFFRKNKFEKVIVLTNEQNFVNVSDHVGSRYISKITDQELIELYRNEERFESDLRASLLICTNNNVARIGLPRFHSMVNCCPKTVFAVHDFDNHHWAEMSLALAACCDVYFPAHMDNYAVAGRVSPNVVAGIPCGTIQWPISFLETHSSDVLTSTRKPDPLGRHYFYERFKYRNQVLRTVGQHFPSVSLVASDYHGQSALDRWGEWISYKLHFIAPVFNDLPIRFFDALVSGGLPMIPQSLVPYLDFLRIPQEHYIAYSASDIFEPSNLVRAAVDVFDRLGNEGILARHQYALSNFHADVSIQKMVGACEEIYT